MGINARGKITCHKKGCGKEIPEDRFECQNGEDHGVPPELRPFVKDNEARAKSAERRALWEPETAHEWVRKGKKPHGY